MYLRQVFCQLNSKVSLFWQKRLWYIFKAKCFSNEITLGFSFIHLINNRVECLALIKNWCKSPLIFSLILLILYIFFYPINACVVDVSETRINRFPWCEYNVILNYGTYISGHHVRNWILSYGWYDFVDRKVCQHLTAVAFSKQKIRSCQSGSLQRINLL